MTRITPVNEYVKFWYYRKIQPFCTYFKYKFTANLSLQIPQLDKTYRIGSYSCYENVIKGILWLVDSVNEEIARGCFLRGFLSTTAA
ncbi:MAG: hypothetical protein ACUZ8I_12160 [Candidatus Scalindua sp.]